MATDLNTLANQLADVLGDSVVSLENRLGELTLVVGAKGMLDVMTQLRDNAALGFDQLIDVCGVDYSAYGSEISEAGSYLPDESITSPFPARFAAVYHLLSVAHNARLRVRVLYGIIFVGHPDLRRILTDYGFAGNPFRKDFPLSGHVEMRYDADQKRVIYEPVSIDPREITPRSVREENFGRQ
jgi:NADH-quinone oxidoreductase subunit C